MAISAILPESSHPQQPRPLYEQLWLDLCAIVDPDKVPPERGLWRELLSLAGASGPTHHVCWILYGRMDRRGRVKAKAQTLADDGGLGVRTVHRSLMHARRIGAVRWRRRRGASWYELNLGGAFTKKRQNCLTGSSRTAPQADLLGLVRTVGKERTSIAAAAVLPMGVPKSDTGQQQQQQRKIGRRNEERIEGLIAACAAKARNLGRRYDEADERQRLAAGEIDVEKLQKLAYDLQDQLDQRHDRRRR